MTVRLDLKPEVEAYLATQARARGVALDAYLEAVIEDLARNEVAPPASVPDLTAILDALAEMGKGLPILPPSGPDTRQHLSGPQLRSCMSSSIRTFCYDY